MSADRYTFDTNVLFYALDVRFPDKHATARSLISEAKPLHCVLLLQSLNELCNVVCRRFPKMIDDVRETVSSANEMFPLIAPSLEDGQAALDAHEGHGLQFWDAMLWATAQRAGCTVLLSEDFQDGRRLGSVTFRNPFAMSKGELREIMS